MSQVISCNRNGGEGRNHYPKYDLLESKIWYTLKSIGCWKAIISIRIICGLVAGIFLANSMQNTFHTAQAEVGNMHDCHPLASYIPEHYSFRSNFTCFACLTVKTSPFSHPFTPWLVPWQGIPCSWMSFTLPERGQWISLEPHWLCVRACMVGHRIPCTDTGKYINTGRGSWGIT